MDVGRLTLWFIVALAGSGMVGYAYGFWEVRPAINVLTMVGAVALTAAVIAGAMFVRAYPRSQTRRIPLPRLPTNRRVGLLWSGAVILIGINAGAFLGFNAGLRTAESVADVLSAVGIVAALAAIAAVLFGIIQVVRSRHRRNSLR